MKQKNLLISLFSVLLLTIFAVCGWLEAAWGKQCDISAEVYANGGIEKIRSWKNEAGEYFLFLPAYAELSRVSIRSDSEVPVFIENIPVTEDTVCSAFPLNTPLSLSYDTLFGSRQDTIFLVQPSKVPTMYIDVESGSMDFIHARKDNKEAGDLRIYGADGQLMNHCRLESMQGRGNATWGLEKNPYNIKLAAEESLLDMGRGQKWILLANYYDRYHLRNKVAYDFARKVGLEFSPDSEWVSLYLNGEYAGLYLLCERNEVHPERVDISTDNSFLISREGWSKLTEQNDPYFGQKDWYGFRIHHAGMPPAEVERIWQSAENALLAEDGIDPVSGKYWLDLIDLDSWVLRYLMDEVFGNFDGGRISQFFYYDGNDGTGKIYAGPVWDMDNITTDTWRTNPGCSFLAKLPNLLDERDKAPFYAISQKAEFQDRLVELYRDVFLPQLEKLLESDLEKYEACIAQSVALEGILYYQEDDYAMGPYLEERMAFLKDYWLDQESFCDILVLVGEDVWGWLAVRPGEPLPPIHAEYLPGVYGYNDTLYRLDTGEPVDVTQPVYESFNVSFGYDGEGTDWMLVLPLSVFVLLLAALWFADKRKNKSVRA